MFTCDKCGFSSANSIRVCKQCGAKLEQPKSGKPFSPFAAFNELDIGHWLSILACLMVAAIVIILLAWLF